MSNASWKPSKGSYGFGTTSGSQIGRIRRAFKDTSGVNRSNLDRFFNSNTAYNSLLETVQ